MKVFLSKSPRPEKKFRVTLEDGRKVDFGGKGYSDFTIHKDIERMRRYVIRHGGYGNLSRSNKEDWSINGIDTAGFWSRWLLWSEPSMPKAKKFMENKFKIRFGKS